MKLYLPNIFSWIRVVLSPVFLLLLLRDGVVMQFLAGIIFAIAAITDYLDGWSARRYHAQSKWGASFDPLADKILTSTAFIAFAELHILDWRLVVLVIARDVYMTALRYVADLKKRPVITSRRAKAKTFSQMTLIIILIVARIAWHIPLLQSIAEVMLYSFVTEMAMAIITAITLLTAVEYTRDNKSLLAELFGRGQNGNS